MEKAAFREPRFGCGRFALIGEVFKGRLHVVGHVLHGAGVNGKDGSGQVDIKCCTLYLVPDYSLHFRLG